MALQYPNQMQTQVCAGAANAFNIAHPKPMTIVELRRSEIGATWARITLEHLGWEPEVILTVHNLDRSTEEFLKAVRSVVKGKLGSAVYASEVQMTIFLADRSDAVLVKLFFG